LTDELLSAGKTINGFLTQKQVECLGERQKHGWYKRLLGKEVSLYAYENFLALRHYKDVVKLPKSARRNLPFKDQYQHPNWLAFRSAILKRDGHKCTRCGSRWNLHVHHLRYIPNLHIWKVPTDFVTTLCENCHQKMHPNRQIT